MHHFVTEMCTFLLQNGALRDMGLVHCGICEMGLLKENPTAQFLGGHFQAGTHKVPLSVAINVTGQVMMTFQCEEGTAIQRPIHNGSGISAF